MLIEVAKFSNHTKNLCKPFRRKILNIRSSSCEREWDDKKESIFCEACFFSYAQCYINIACFDYTSIACSQYKEYL